MVWLQIKNLTKTKELTSTLILFSCSGPIAPTKSSHQEEVSARKFVQKQLVSPQIKNLTKIGN